MSFNFKSLGHFFASVFHDIHVAATAINTKILPVIEKEAPVIEGVTGLIPGVGTAAQIIERAAFASLGQVAAAVHGADAAALANGVNVQLDAEFVADIQALIKTYAADLNLKPAA